MSAQNSEIFYPNDYRNTSRQIQNTKKHLRRVKDNYPTGRETGGVAVSSVKSSFGELLFTSECDGVLRASGTLPVAYLTGIRVAAKTMAALGASSDF